MFTLNESPAGTYYLYIAYLRLFIKLKTFWVGNKLIYLEINHIMDKAWIFLS